MDGTPTVANPYHYADNDPLNKVDPLGERPNDCKQGDGSHANACPAKGTVSFAGDQRMARYKALGRITIAAFISAKESRINVAGPLPFEKGSYWGDNRGFSGDSPIPVEKNRLYMDISFISQTIRYYLHPTCAVNDPAGHCFDQFPVKFNQGLGGRFRRSSDHTNYLQVGFTGDTLSIAWSVVHSDTRAWSDLSRPSVDGELKLTPNNGNAEAEFDADCFPSYEIHIGGVGGVKEREVMRTSELGPTNLFSGIGHFSCNQKFSFNSRGLVR